MSLPARIQLSRLFVKLDSPTRGRIASRSGVTPRQITNLIVGQPVSAIAFLRLSAAMAFDPLPEIPHAFVRPASFDFGFFALAFRMRCLYEKHTVAKVAAILDVGGMTILRIEHGDAQPIGVVLKVCKYLNQHPFSFFAPIPGQPTFGDVSRETIRSRETSSETTETLSLPVA